MSEGVELATAYLSLIPSMKGASGKIKEQLNPASEEAGSEAGASMGKMILGGVAKFAAPVAAIAAGFGIHEEVKKSQEAFEGWAGTAFRMQSITGGSTAQVTGLMGAMQEFGMSADESQGTLARMARTLGNQNMSAKQAADLTKQLGFAFRDANGQVLPMSELMPKIADKFQSMPDGAEKTALAMQLFGRSGAQMIPMLDQGSAGLAQLTEKATKAGLVLDDTSMRIFMNARLSAAQFKTAIQGVQVSLGQDLVPVMDAVHNVGHDIMIPVLNAIAGVLNTMREPAMKFAEEVEKMGEKSGDKVTDLLGKLKPIGAAIGDVFKGFTTGTYSNGLEHFGAIASAAFAMVLNAVRDVKKDIKDVFTGFTTGEYTNGLSKVGAVASAAFSGIMSTIHSVMSQVGPIIHDVVANVSSAFKGVDFGGLISQVMQLSSVFSPLHYALEAIKPVLPQLVSAFSELAGTVGRTLLSVFSTLAPVVLNLSQTLIQLLQGAMVQILPVVVQLIGTLGQTFAKLVPVISQVIATVYPLVASLIAQLIPVIIRLVTTILPPIIQIVTQIISAIGPLITTLVGVLIPVIQALLPVVTTVFGVIANVITAAMQIVQGIIEIVLGIITGNWQLVWDGIKDVLSGVWNTIVALVTGAIQILNVVITAALSIIGTIWNAVWSGISSFFADVWNGIVAIFNWEINTVLSVIQSVLSFISSVWNAAWSGISGFFSSIWNGMVNGIASGIDNIMGFFGSLPDRIMGFFAGAGSWLVSVGQNLINGLISGIQAMAGAIGSALINLLPGPLRDLAHTLGIASPSRLMADRFGKPIGQGVAVGIDESQRDVSLSMSRLVRIPAAPSGVNAVPATGGGFTVINNIQTNDPEGAAIAVTRRLQRAAV